MGYLKKEENILPLQVALDIFGTMMELKRDSLKNYTKTPEVLPTGFHSFSKKFESWILSLLDPYFLSHTWNNFGNGEEQAWAGLLTEADNFPGRPPH